jgi:hypothetical protein
VHVARAPDPIRGVPFNERMIEPEQAKAIEEKLATLLGVRVKDLRDYMGGSIRAGGERSTGYRFVRGTHAGRYVRDPNGTDIIPASYEIPA